jgi:hypothetical protein
MRLKSYKQPLKEIINRFCWDISKLGYNSNRKLKLLHNKYAGKKAVILCNGPSLNSVNFDIIDDVYSFGLNKIYLKFHSSTFRPNSIVCINKEVFEQSHNEFSEFEGELFFCSKAFKFFGYQDNITYFNRSGRCSFNADFSLSHVYDGGTVTYIAIQLAYHMGFEKVTLVGCDHSFKGYTGKPWEKSVFEGDDINHFDPEYFKGQKWGHPNLPVMEHAYSLAYEFFSKNNREIYNSTEGGALNIFPRISLDDFLLL